jgi:hypothetical protein
MPIGFEAPAPTRGWGGSLVFELGQLARVNRIGLRARPPDEPHVKGVRDSRRMPLLGQPRRQPLALPRRFEANRDAPAAHRAACAPRRARWRSPGPSRWRFHEALLRIEDQHGDLARTRRRTAPTSKKCYPCPQTNPLPMSLTVHPMKLSGGRRNYSAISQTNRIGCDGYSASSVNSASNDASASALCARQMALVSPTVSTTRPPRRMRTRLDAEARRSAAATSEDGCVYAIWR